VNDIDPLLEDIFCLWHKPSSSDQMQFSSVLEPEKHHDYHLLPDSGSALETGLKNGRRREGAPHRHHKDDIPEDVPLHRKPYLNKYALAGAVLASTNSILLGYGKIYAFDLFS
jgi:hypothetical protein